MSTGADYKFHIYNIYRSEDDISHCNSKLSCPRFWQRKVNIYIDETRYLLQCKHETYSFSMTLSKYCDWDSNIVLAIWHHDGKFITI